MRSLKWDFRRQVLALALSVVAGLQSMSLPVRARDLAAVTGDCQVPTAAAVAAMIDQLNAALRTQHPDRVTELFAQDAEVLGFASAVPRNRYAGIREYYLYFLQFEPQIRVTSRQIQTGCNFAIDAGTYVWTLKSNATATVEQREARYSFVYAFSDGDWQIAQYSDALVTANAADAAFAVPPPSGVRTAVAPQAKAAPAAKTVPAVAGFVRRSGPVAKLKPAPTPEMKPAPGDDAGAWLSDLNRYGQ